MKWRLSKLPLRDGNYGPSSSCPPRRRPFETSSEGWKLLKASIEYIDGANPFETSSEGWKRNASASSSGKIDLSKLPLRDGNLIVSDTGEFLAELSKLPLRDGNILSKSNLTTLPSPFETSSEGWKL